MNVLSKLLAPSPSASRSSSPPPSAAAPTPSPASASLKMPPPAAWTPARARIQLKLSIQRTRVLATKKSQLAKSTRREIANLLDKGKVESARIKVEGIMQEDLMCELLELLELFCEVLLARFGLLETIK